MRTTGQQAGTRAVTDRDRMSIPLPRWLVRRRDDAVVALVRRIDPAGIHDVGCGDGERVLRWDRAGMTARGSDDSGNAIDRARERAVAAGQDDLLFSVRRVHHLEVPDDAAELVVCCDVLERVADPDLALRRLQIVTERYLVVSVTRQPWASLLNLGCGRHWMRSGRAPAQANQWSRRAFVDLVSQYFVVDEVLGPFPWTTLLCRAQTDTQVVRHLGAP